VTKVSRNSYSEGMDRDTSVSKFSPDRYFNLENFEVIANDEANSSWSLTNKRGTTRLFEVSDVAFLSFSGTLPADVSVTIVTTPGGTAFSTSYGGTDVRTIYDLTANNLNTLTNFTVVASDKGIYIYNTTDFDFTITVTSPSGLWSITFYDNPLIIGHAIIRDRLVLFTTTAGVGTGVLQIWRITYSDEDLTISDNTLVWCDGDDYSQSSPIEAVGRYETDTLENVYWITDSQDPRVINIVNIDSLSIDPGLLDFSPSSNLTKPLLGENISTGGSLLTGIYQYSYRLRSEDGAETRFSPLSDLIHVVLGSENKPHYWLYTGTGATSGQTEREYNGSDVGHVSNKSVSLIIGSTTEPIDQRYDYIEVAAVYRAALTGILTLTVFEVKEISGTSMNFVHSGNEDAPFTLATTAITAFNTSIITTKGIAVKDNILLLARTTTRETNVLELDCRAYRFNGTNTISDISDSNLGNITLTTPNPNYTGVDSSHDAINSYNQFTTVVGNPTNTHFKYTDSGALTLGGSGANVSYRFIREPMDGTTDGIKTFTNGRIEVPLINNTSDPWNDFKDPVFHAGFKGYQRGEIYRFGLVFFDKKGVPGFVNWIGDIRFPYAYEGVDGLGGATDAHWQYSSGNTPHYLLFLLSQ